MNRTNMLLPDPASQPASICPTHIGSLPPAHIFVPWLTVKLVCCLILPTIILLLPPVHTPLLSVRPQFLAASLHTPCICISKEILGQGVKEPLMDKRNHL